MSRGYPVEASLKRDPVGAEGATVSALARVVTVTTLDPVVLPDMSRGFDRRGQVVDRLGRRRPDPTGLTAGTERPGAGGGVAAGSVVAVTVSLGERW